MQKNYKKLFLASNGAEGFVSYFKESYNPREGWRAFIIKGGPGTGKSSIMKTVAKSAKAAGCDPVLVFCSSDPDSLDGVIINEKKAIILDGTAPHIVEPTLYGACEITVNPGDYLSIETLRENFAEIREKTDENKFYHLAASRYLSAAGQVKKDNLRLSYSALDVLKAQKYAAYLAQKYFIKKEKAPGASFNCFLNAVTSKGVVDYGDTIDLWCEKKVVIEDKYLAATGEIMRIIKAKAQSAGYDVISLNDPLYPDICRHVIIPELSLGFFTESRELKFETDARRIHARRFYDTHTLSGIKNRMRFNNKVYDELIKCAVLNLKKAKQIHDIIEEYYIEAMDFGGAKVITEKLLKAIFDKNFK